MAGPSLEVRFSLRLLRLWREEASAAKVTRLFRRSCEWPRSERCHAPHCGRRSPRQHLMRPRASAGAPPRTPVPPITTATFPGEIEKSFAHLLERSAARCFAADLCGRRRAVLLVVHLRAGGHTTASSTNEALQVGPERKRCPNACSDCEIPYSIRKLWHTESEPMIVPGNTRANEWAAVVCKRRSVTPLAPLS